MSYLEKIIKDVKDKYSSETEYIQAVEETLLSLKPYIEEHPELESYSILERFVIPERIITFKVTWMDDTNKIHVNTGYRVQFNSAIGPYKGGLRFRDNVNLSILKFLGFEQTLKNSLTGLNMGGGKGGSDFDPKGKSDTEIMRFCQAFMTELYKYIGADIDIPAGDIGVGAKEIGYLFGQYKKITNRFNGVLTGKGLTYGGSLGRKEATGYGLCYFASKMLDKMSKTSFKDKKVIISGSGNVALYACKKVYELGGTVIAMSDSNGYIYNSKGIDFNKVRQLKEVERKRISEYVLLDSSASYLEGSKGIWGIKCDITLPCATQNEIDLEDAKVLISNGVILVAEGANMPCTLEATNYFIKHKVLYGPAKASNCGGVMVSGFEMGQNAMHLNWSFEEVDTKLKNQMEQIYEEIYECALHYGNVYNTVLGANIIGFDKVSKAMIAEGVLPSAFFIKDNKIGYFIHEKYYSE